MANRVVLDEHNSDLNFLIDNYGLGGTTLNLPLGFRLLWAGARATHGVCKGKVYFEVKVEDFLDSVCDGDHVEVHSNVVRIGWSRNSTPFSLGDVECSYGYGGTGTFVTKGHYTKYGVSFGKGDVIGALLDLESKPATISFMKNGEFLGTAYTLVDFHVGKTSRALFPHVYSKNCRVKLNFGRDEPWFPPPQGFKYIDNLGDKEKIRGNVAPAQKSDCQIVMVIGLPGSGKSTYIRNLQKKHPDKNFNILGLDKLLYQVKVAGVTQSYVDRYAMLEEMTSECFDALIGIAASRHRDYVIDQTNLYAPERQRVMSRFQGFLRIAVVVQPADAELLSRFKKRSEKFKREIPFTAIRKMKANFKLPDAQDNLFDKIEYAGLPKSDVEALVSRYNSENAQYRF